MAARLKRHEKADQQLRELEQELDREREGTVQHTSRPRREPTIEHTSAIRSENETLVDDVNPSKTVHVTSETQTLGDDLISVQAHHVTINDWSQTGRGSHVDFADDEKVPLGPGRRALLKSPQLRPI